MQQTDMSTVIQANPLFFLLQQIILTLFLKHLIKQFYIDIHFYDNSRLKATNLFWTDDS